MLNSVVISSRARISAHTIRDHLNNSACEKVTDVPWCAEAISAQWLTPILCKDSPDAEVITVNVEDASSGSSVRKRIAVDYNAVGRRN